MKTVGIGAVILLVLLFLVYLIGCCVTLQHAPDTNTTPAPTAPYPIVPYPVPPTPAPCHQAAPCHAP